MVDFRTRTSETSWDMGNNPETWGPKRSLNAGQFSNHNTVDMTSDQVGIHTDMRYLKPNQASPTPDFPIPLLSSIYFPSSFPIYISHPQLYHHLRTQSSVSPWYLSMPWSWVNTKYCIHHVPYTPSTAHTQYCTYWVYHKLCTACTEYSIHFVPQTPSAAHTPYCIHRGLHVLSTANAEHYIHRVLCTCSTGCTKYCIHRHCIPRVLHILRTSFSQHWLTAFHSQCYKLTPKCSFSFQSASL